MKESEPHHPSASSTTHAAPGRASHPPRKRRRGRSVLVLIAAVVLVFLAVRIFSNKKKAPPPPQPIPVSAAKVTKGDIDIVVDALGTVTPVYTVTVTSRVTGELTEVDYKEGQMVRKGDLLAVIDPRPYQAAVIQAEGQLARDQALLKNAGIDLSRYQNAYQQHAVPEQQVATQQALVDQDGGTVRLDQGNLDAAQVNLDYTRIASPIEGRVGLRDVDPGNIVTANGTTALATLTQLQPITVIFTLAEDELGAVAAQTSAGHTLRVDALDRTQQRRLAEGTLITLDNQINPATGTVRARAIFANRDHRLFPNQFVNARLYVRTLSGVNLVSDAAIQRNGDATYVYVITGGAAQSRNVKILATEGEAVALTGVNPGDQVVTDGFDKLQNGTKVVVRQVPAAQSQADQAE